MYLFWATTVELPSIVLGHILVVLPMIPLRVCISVSYADYTRSYFLMAAIYASFAPSPMCLLRFPAAVRRQRSQPTATPALEGAQIDMYLYTCRWMWFLKRVADESGALYIVELLPFVPPLLSF